MNLGQFSVSLSVEDIAVSRAFYETLGFTVYDGNQSDGWLIMKNGDSAVGLFQGMFEGNLLTFNPPDVRSVQEHLDRNGITLLERAEPGSGPAHATLTDPDGNVILLDQFPEDYAPDPHVE
jgi:catechol 2,3-dioxygenase-like lactoylglutathione lyase family enzyme